MDEVMNEFCLIYDELYRVPEKNEQPNFKYTEVVRKRDERQKLKGFGCKECDRVSFFEFVG